MTTFHTIVLPVRPQPDTIVAIFILKLFGRERFPGVENASFAFWPKLPNEQTAEQLEQTGHLLIDLGGGRFDHHNKDPKTTASALVATELNAAANPSLTKLLAYAERDDFYGKGTISEDTIDRALGLSGLIAALNKSWPQHPEYVIAAVLPLIDGHWQEENRRANEFPAEVETQRRAGKVSELTVKQRDKKLKVILLESDNVGLAGYLRSQLGGRYDVVVQKTAAGYVNILTRPTKHIDLRGLAAIIRVKEACSVGRTLSDNFRRLAIPGRLNEVPDWYYDTATNSLLNGGLLPTADIHPTRLSLSDLEIIIPLGLTGQTFTSDSALSR